MHLTSPCWPRLSLAQPLLAVDTSSPSSPHTRQRPRDSSRATRCKPRSSPSFFKKNQGGRIDVRTSTDLYLIDSSFCPRTSRPQRTFWYPRTTTALYRGTTSTLLVQLAALLGQPVGHFCAKRDGFYLLYAADLRWLYTRPQFTPLLLGVQIGVLLLPYRVSTFVLSSWLDSKQCIYSSFCRLCHLSLLSSLYCTFTDHTV